MLVRELSVEFMLRKWKAMDETKILATEPYEKPLELLPLVSGLFRKWLWIVAAAGTFALITFAGVKIFVTPMYCSEFMAYISNHKTVYDQTEGVAAADLNASRILADTYAALINSRGFLEQAALRAGMDIPSDTLCSMVEAETVADTELLLVSVTDSDPYRAQSLAQAIADEAVIRIGEILEGSAMLVIQSPELPEKPCAPKTARYVVFAVLLGALVAICVITFVYVLDVYIDLNTAEKDFGYPMLASVEEYGARFGMAGKTASFRTTQEEFRTLRMALDARCLGSENRCIAVSYAGQEMRNSDMSIKLAGALVQTGKRVLLIHCAVETAGFNAGLLPQGTAGLGDYLAGKIPLAEVEIRRMNGVDVMAAGNLPCGSGAMLESSRMETLLRKAREKYKWVILDTSSEGAMAMSQVVDGYLLVLCHQKTKTKEVRKIIRNLELANADILGFVGCNAPR